MDTEIMGRMHVRWRERIRFESLKEARGALAIWGTIVLLLGAGWFLIPDPRPIVMVYRIALVATGVIFIALALRARVNPRTALVTATFFLCLLFVAQFIRQWATADPDHEWRWSNWLLFFPLAYGLQSAFRIRGRDDHEGYSSSRSRTDPPKPEHP
jgi:hypothetical protein